MMGNELVYDSEYINDTISNKFITDMSEKLKPGEKIFYTRKILGTDYFGEPQKIYTVMTIDKMGNVRTYRHFNTSYSIWDEV